jgi:hypothetical protein
MGIGISIYWVTKQKYNNNNNNNNCLRQTGQRLFYIYLNEHETQT